jgi:hypothetical protein
MTTKTVYIYNFSGATTPGISIHWGSTGQPATTNLTWKIDIYAPTTDVTPWKIENIPNDFDTYNLWYNTTSNTTGSHYPLVFDGNGVGDVFIFNDPGIVLTTGSVGAYYSMGYRVDNAYIINGTNYQTAKTYKFPARYLAFSVPAVSQTDMNKLKLVSNAFATGSSGSGGDKGEGGDGGDTTPTDSTNYWYWIIIAIIVIFFILLLAGGTFYLVKKKK